MSWVHGVLGLGILVLAPWKSVIVRRGLRRRRRHAVAVAFAIVVAVSLVAGIVHATLGPLQVAGFNVLAVHVAAAVAAVPLALRHVVRRRQRVRATDLSRRTALRAIVVAGTAALAYAALESATSLAGLSWGTTPCNRVLQLGSGQPALMPVTQWFTDDVPTIDPAAYKLRVSRPGERTLRISHDDLLAMTSTTRSAVLDCTGGWWAEQTWRGVQLDTLLGPHTSGSIAGAFGDGLHQTLPIRGRLHSAARYARRRHTALARPWRARQAGRPRTPWLLVGQVGPARQSRITALVVAVAVPSPVRHPRPPQRHIETAKRAETQSRRIEKFVARLARGETIHPNTAGRQDDHRDA